MSEETKKIELGGEGLYDARKLGSTQDAGAGRATHIRHVWRDGARAHSDGYQRFHGAAVRGHRNCCCSIC